jgi:hypothetical protein
VEEVPAQQQQQQQQQEEAENEYFEFPRKFKTGYKALLAATQADWARGSIREIKCRRCPNTNTTLKTWEDFKRHCDTTETHPLKIFFCNHCGDFFARCDSLQRHRNHRPAECMSITPEKADEKRRETQRIHDEFIARLEAFLRTGEEDVEIPFSQIIKGMYPESSKKKKSASSMDATNQRWTFFFESKCWTLHHAYRIPSCLFLFFCSTRGPRGGVP